MIRVWVRVRIWDRVRVTVRVIVTVRVRVSKESGSVGNFRVWFGFRVRLSLLLCLMNYR